MGLLFLSFFFLVQLEQNERCSKKNHCTVLFQLCILTPSLTDKSSTIYY